MKTDLQKFIEKFEPSNFKQLKNGIEVRGVTNFEEDMNKARRLINEQSLGLEVVNTADMAAYRAYEIREVLK